MEYHIPKEIEGGKQFLPSDVSKKWSRDMATIIYDQAARGYTTPSIAVSLQRLYKHREISYSTIKRWISSSRDCVPALREAYVAGMAEYYRLLEALRFTALTGRPTRKDEQGRDIYKSDIHLHVLASELKDRFRRLQTPEEREEMETENIHKDVLDYINMRRIEDKNARTESPM